MKQTLLHRGVCLLSERNFGKGPGRWLSGEVRENLSLDPQNTNGSQVWWCMGRRWTLVEPGGLFSSQSRRNGKLRVL